LKKGAKMLSKKIFLSAAFVSMAGFVACGDDSSSNSGSGELPKSVPTFFDLADVECNADRKCETIIVEEGPDTYECDGVSQWNMLINSMPSKVCPAKEEEKGTEGDEEGKTEGDDNKTPESSASETTSTDSGAESTDSNTESTDSGEKSSGSAPVAMISCDNLPEEGQKPLAPWAKNVQNLKKDPWPPPLWNCVAKTTVAPWAQDAPPKKTRATTTALTRASATPSSGEISPLGILSVPMPSVNLQPTRIPLTVQS
jgi:hypothetical protein